MGAASVLTLVARVVLALVFAVAALAKLLDPEGTRSATLALGVPRRVARPVAFALPIVEAALAVGLVVPATAPAAAVAAGILLIVLGGIVVANLAAHRRPSCHCFGSDDHEIGWRTVARNLLLAGVAGAVAWRSTRSDDCAIGCVSDASATHWWVASGVAVGLMVLAANAWVLVNLVRQNGRLAERVAILEGARPPAEPPVVGLPPGAAAVDFVLNRADDTTASLAGILAEGRAAILLFVEPACAACVDLGRWIADMPAWRADAPHLVLVARGSTPHVAEAFRGRDGVEVLVDPYGQIHAAYRVAATPSAVLVSAAGTIASRTAQGRRSVEDLIDRHHNAVRFAAATNGATA
jgi:uncharacterized membrane protein YphA (DoxX/SURF4 family)